MTESNIIPLKLGQEDGILYRYSRKAWFATGQDDFTKAPGQNPDLCELLLNILPPETNALQRRFGYISFAPKLDTGGALQDDRAANSALYGVITDGAAGVVTTAISTTVNYTPSFSIEFWFQTGSAAGGTFVSQNANVAITGSEQMYTAVYMDTAGKIGAGFYNGTNVSASTVTPLAYNDGLGHNCVVTFNGGTIIIYVDGVAVVTTTGLTTAVSTHAAYWRLAHGSEGTGWPSPTFYPGFLSHVSIWNVVLSQAQVTAHYDALHAASGSQANYEIIVENDAPVYFWYLNETLSAVPPPVSPIVQTASGHSTNATVVVTLSAGVTPGNKLLVVAAQRNGNAFTLSDNHSTSYTQIDEIHALGDIRLATYWAKITAGGTTTVTVTASGAAEQTFLMVLELYSTATSPIDQHGIAEAFSSTFTAPSVTTATTPDVVFGIAYGNGSITLGAGGDYALVDAISGSKADGGNPLIVEVAQTSAKTTITTQSSWSQTGSQAHATATIAITMVSPTFGATKNAFDYADSNTGTYSSTGVIYGQYLLIL